MQDMRSWVILVGAFLAASGCGDDDGRSDAAPTTAVISGRVFAPNQGPTQALLGQEVPVSGALVYVSPTPPEPIPSGVYCERCVAVPSTGVLTGADGSFRLEVEPGRYWVVIQKGQFRLQGEYDLAGVMEVPYEQTTLPSVNDPEMGKTMPRIAMAQGSHDRIEDVLGKLGIRNGTADGPEISVYAWEAAATETFSVAYLLSNMEELRRFHIVFFPCQTEIPAELAALLRDQTVLTNIRRYVNEGGKIYVTDWSGEVADHAFPQQLELGDANADSDGTYDATTLAGTLTVDGTADGDFYDATDARILDPDLSAWLGLQSGPDDDGLVTTYDPSSFEVPDVWNWIKKTNPVQIGVDGQGLPVYDTPKVWMTGTRPNASGGAARPLAVTYQPTGCGKVLYTPFQTTTTQHPGLTAKERVLLYLILEISTCAPDPFE
jgi:hypothetical protein